MNDELNDCVCLVQGPLMEKEAQFKLLEVEELNQNAQLEALTPKLNELLEASDAAMKGIRERQSRRDESVARFFELEESVAKEWTKLLATALHDARHLANKSAVLMSELGKLPALLQVTSQQHGRRGC